MESTYNVGDMIRFYRTDVEGMLEGMLEGVPTEPYLDGYFCWVIGDDGNEYEVDLRDIEGIV